MKPALAGCFLALFFPEICMACTCAFPTFEEQMKKATAVFTGKVLSSEHDGENLQLTLEVDKRWKGPSEKTIVIETAENSAACGYPFELEKIYLVYATGKEKLSVSLCSRTKRLIDAKEDLDRLEVSVRPKAPARDPFTTMKGDRFTPNKTVPKALNITHAVIVGITKKSDGYVALVRALDNKVYFLKAGDKLHDGVVVKIDSNNVTFRQYSGSRSVLVKKQLRPFPDN